MVSEHDLNTTTLWAQGEYKFSFLQNIYIYKYFTRKIIDINCVLHISKSNNKVPWLKNLVNQHQVDHKCMWN
jgi:hypothetical protein